MGVYLSKPVTDKHSEDVENEVLECGASTMQGWRDSQEDAHNCILDFDTKTSLFAVYDGHGGCDVAKYAAKKLPSFVKNKSYTKGNYKKALIKAYLDFDDTLLKSSVIDELNVIKKRKKKEEESDEEPENLSELKKEAQLPIEEILNKYKTKIVKSKPNDNQPSSSSSSASKSKITNETSSASGSCSSASAGSKLNGTECGPSSSKGINGSEEKQYQSPLAELILKNIFSCSAADDDDSDNNDDDDDDDDEEDDTFEVTNDDLYTDDSDDSDYYKNGPDGLPKKYMFPNPFEKKDDDSDDSDDEQEVGKDSGATAVMALLVNNKLFVANAGDSRCVLSIDGKAYDMSTDHKPEDEIEAKRIVAAGGKVTEDGRVNNGLNLSRALGDHNYKKNIDLPNTEQMVTALPEVSVKEIEPGNQNFIVLACDGIWNSLSSQEVVDFITERLLNSDIKLSKICEELFDHCLAPNTASDGTGCDNMTCIIVKLKQRPKRSRLEDENNKCDDNGAECKKPKSDLTKSESVQ